MHSICKCSRFRPSKHWPVPIRNNEPRTGISIFHTALGKCTALQRRAVYANTVKLSANQDI